MDDLPLLIVDADQNANHRLTQFTRRLVKRVLCAANAAEAVCILQQGPVAGMFCELQLPDRAGLSLVAEARRIHPRLPVTIVTGEGSIEDTIDAFRSGVADFIIKPICQSAVATAWNRMLAGSAQPSTGGGRGIADAAAKDDADAMSIPVNTSLKQIEKHAVREVIYRLDGNKAAAARALGIHRKALYRLLDS